MINTELKGKVVLVTGGNHGIGAATARAFAKEGAKVFINYLRLSPKEYGGISQEPARKAKAPGIAYYHAMQTKSASKEPHTFAVGFFTFSFSLVNIYPTRE